MSLDIARDLILRLPFVGDAWATLKRRRLLRQYVSRREHYARAARQQGLSYRESDVVREVRARLVKRGHTPPRRTLGDIHTYAFIPRIGWHTSLLPDLYELGPVTHFDYTRCGYQWDVFQHSGSAPVQRRRAMLDNALASMRAAHAERPLDWVFIYASGAEISSVFVKRIVDEFGIPVVNMCLDDKQSWTGPVFDSHRVGQVDIAAGFDISWTSARVACEWYLGEGARPLYMPEGFDARLFRPLSVPQDIPVSFVGGRYGFRPAVIRHLRRNHIQIDVFGAGWGTRSISVEAQVEILNRSCINLGMGGIGYCEGLTNVKGRDFEIPGVGGGLYLTSFNPDLAEHFHVGQEIVCYRNREEMVELIRYYLDRPDVCGEIARRGRQRSLRQHRWLHRYVKLCQILGILSANSLAGPLDDPGRPPACAPALNSTPEAA